MKTRWRIVAIAAVLAALAAGPVWSESAPLGSHPTSPPLAKMNLYLTAGDYRRALEACQRSIDDAPSAATYVHLTYVYHAIDAYLEHLAKEERWITVEHLYLNLASRGTEDLVDPPGGLARMAKEMIQLSVRQQSDVSAAMANRLEKAEVDRLWTQQAKWRAIHPGTWWQSFPAAWIDGEG
ncbi:MAG: hypothetical protein ICV75_00070 [Nitrospiraceae bacterium]|nr:hypothetical protein [Nitrospiraceae bacterium]